MSPTLAELGLDVVPNGTFGKLVGDKERIELTESGAKWLNKAYGRKDDQSGSFAAGQEIQLPIIASMGDINGNKWTNVNILMNIGTAEEYLEERVAIELENHDLFIRSETLRRISEILFPLE